MAVSCESSEHVPSVPILGLGSYHNGHTCTLHSALIAYAWKTIFWLRLRDIAVRIFISLFQLMSINKCLVTAWLIAFVLSIIVVDCLHVVTEGTNTFQNNTTLVTGLQVIIFVCWILFLKKKFQGIMVLCPKFFLSQENITYQCWLLFLHWHRWRLFLDFWLPPLSRSSLTFLLILLGPSSFPLLNRFLIVTVKTIEIQIGRRITNILSVELLLQKPFYQCYRWIRLLTHTFFHALFLDSPICAWAGRTEPNDEIFSALGKCHFAFFRNPSWARKSFLHQFQATSGVGTEVADTCWSVLKGGNTQGFQVILTQKVSSVVCPSPHSDHIHPCVKVGKNLNRMIWFFIYAEVVSCSLYLYPLFHLDQWKTQILQDCREVFQIHHAFWDLTVLPWNIQQFLFTFYQSQGLVKLWPINSFIRFYHSLWNIRCNIIPLVYSCLFPPLIHWYTDTLCPIEFSRHIIHQNGMSSMKKAPLHLLPFSLQFV